MPKNVYVHIPFCKQKCKYCSFTSFTNLDRISSYILALLREIDTKYNNEEVETLYFGGGTPSLLDASSVKSILTKFKLAKNCEITFEVNPDDVNLSYCKNLYDIGINRLSIGSQTFNDSTLKLIGRRHNSSQIKKAVDDAKNAGFKNISLDLIYGLPNSDIKEDLYNLINLEVQHISTYGLKIEEESYWGKVPPSSLPDDDEQADMYFFINEYLQERGYKRYEISNFSLLGFESKHNLNYWDNKEYYGFGVSAHGYIDKMRYSNTNSLDEYIMNPIDCYCKSFLNKAEILQEEIFLGFRRESGINISLINKKFGIDFEKKFEFVLDKYVPRFIIKDNNNYKLTVEGVLLSNIILADFI